MTARDRAKIRDRFIRHLAHKLLGKDLTVDNMVDFTVREVDRAVKAERKKRGEENNARIWGKP